MPCAYEIEEPRNNIFRKLSVTKMKMLRRMSDKNRTDRKG